jgi:hypothetical protein
VERVRVTKGRDARYVGTGKGKGTREGMHSRDKGLVGGKGKSGVRERML